MPQTSSALMGNDIEALTRAHSTELSELNVMEKSLQDFAFSYNQEILQGRAELALSILEQWQPILFSEINPSDQELISKEYIWVRDILVAALIGWPPTLIETVSLYASDYPQGVTRENLTVADKIGLELWALFASLPTSLSAALPNLASTTLIDDYHDVTPQRGAEFVLEVAHLLHQIGLITDNDIPGRNYVLLRESAMLSRSQEILALLETSGGEVIFQEESSRFIPNEKFWESSEILSKSRRKQIRKQGVLLFERNKPSCPLMDAAAYLRNTNYHYLHVKIFPESYKPQQDDTYTLLHAAKIIPKGQYHNLFFQEDPAALLQIIELLKTGLREIISEKSTFSKWSEFSSEKYAQENYFPAVNDHDQEVIAVVQQDLQDLLGEQKVAKAIDIGAAGNLYPGLLWTPYAEQIELWEYTSQGREWLSDSLAAEQWAPFAKLISPDSLTQLRERGKIRYGSISDLLSGNVEALSAFFVAERITAHSVYIRMMIRRMIESLRDGGVFVFAHSLESEPYQAGGIFPAVALQVEELRKIYNALPVEYNFHHLSAGLASSQGTVILTGRKASGPLDSRGSLLA